MEGGKVSAVFGALVVGAIILQTNIYLLGRFLPRDVILEGWETRVFIATTFIVLVIVYFLLDYIFENISRKYHYRRARKRGV